MLQPIAVLRDITLKVNFQWKYTFLTQVKKYMKCRNNFYHCCHVTVMLSIKNDNEPFKWHIYHTYYHLSAN